ncbi:MAG: cysteine desulfurase family protein [Myxococcaceae bacterium]
MIYWDHNATSPLREEVRAVLDESLRHFAVHPGNASSVHGGGRAARERLESARARVAKILGAQPREVVFTGSGSEANALALKGIFAGSKRTRLVTTTIEHPALLAAAAQLEKQGVQVTRVPVGTTGHVAVDDVLRVLGDDVALCSVMWANNETGALQPVREIARACGERGIKFHTDAVQAAGKVETNLREVNADFLSLAGHKLGAPAGVGVLVVRDAQLGALTPGHQELGRRGGTSNVPYAEAFATALELATRELPAYSTRMSALRDSFERRLSNVVINSGTVPRIPNTSNVRFPGADGEALLIALDLEGVCVSSGAACASGSLTPSHVLKAMGMSSTEAQESLRFSMGPETTEAEVERVVALLKR